MNNWEGKSDHEINESVKALLIETHDKESELDRFFLAILKMSNFDYCNDAAHAWSIILENKISIMNDGELWEASIDFEGDLLNHGTDETLTKYNEHKNPLRAAMIVFLEMNGVKPNE